MLSRVLRPGSGGHWLTLAGAGLVLGPLGDVEPERGGACVLLSASVLVYEGSRLFDARDGRLTLARGRALPCDQPSARAVLRALEAALDEGIGERVTTPLRVHVDPRLPSRQAPLTGVEVHVSSREILVASAVLADLPERAWRHELLHALAAAPPPLSQTGRQLWLTLEEGLVTFLTDADGSLDGMEHPGPQLLPLLEWLESPAYDPHPLAAGLARELGRTAAEASPFLDCLMRQPARAPRLPEPAPLEPVLAEPALPAELTDVFVAFAARCSAGAQAHWTAALQHWWGAAPASPVTERALGKAAARTLESR